MRNNKNNAIYEKALKLYNEGEIDKAIEVCEEGISNSLKDSKLLNLKGLLLYIKGELKGAVALWKINKDYNNDSISKAYLEDSKNDFNRYNLCKEAESLIDGLYIDEALANLIECVKSDFNLIEVNNLMASAYMKKGQYDNSRLCLEKVLTIDKYNLKAKSLLNEINDLLEPKNRNGLLIGSLGLIVILVLALFFANKFGIININIKKEKATTISEIKKENNNKNQTNNIKEDNSNKTLEEQKETNTEVNNKEDINKENNKENNKEDTITSEEFKQLTKSEIQNNYSEGSYYFKRKNYEEVIKIFEETKKSSKNSDLNDDILFFLAASYQATKQDEKAIECYKDFLSQYEKGNYVEEAFYKLILLSKEKDINTSKEYAKKVILK